MSQTLDEALAAFAAHDAQAFCRSVSDQAKLLIGLAAHTHRPIECEKDVRRYFRETLPYRGGPRPRLVEVAERGDDTVAARFELADGSPVTLSLSKVGDAWRLNGPFDATLSPAQTPHDARRLAVNTTPRLPAGGSVTVRDLRKPGGPRCDDLRLETFYEVRGGCTLNFQAPGAQLSIWSPFGVMPFGTCDVSFALHLDGSGRGWVTDLRVVGPSLCYDTYQCWDADTMRVPWPAAIETGDRGTLTLAIDDVCLDTCTGRFRGDWRLRITERSDAWRMRFDSMLGTSGWRIRGTASSKGKPVAIDRQPAAPAASASSS